MPEPDQTEATPAVPPRELAASEARILELAMLEATLPPGPAAEPPQNAPPEEPGAAAEPEPPEDG